MSEEIAKMDALAHDGWCVVLKKLPPGEPWIVEGSRSEYDAPAEDRHVGHNQWHCSVSDMRKYDDPRAWRLPRFAFGDTALAAIRKVQSLIAEDAKKKSKGQHHE